MEDCTSFTDRLEQSLLAKTAHMDGAELKQLKDDFRLFSSAFQAIFNVLLKKGLISEDPYKYELKISEVTTPPESPFAESEKIDQMSIRLSQFESYLDFLNNYYQFSVDFLSMGRIKRLVSLTKYFNFTQFTDNSQHINTKYFAELVSLIKKGSDPMSTGIINEGLLQLDKTSRKIFNTLKNLTLIHKERYKLKVRRLVTCHLGLERDYVVTHQEDCLRKIRQRMVDAGEKTFYQELVIEVLNEDYSAEAENLRDELFKNLEVSVEQKQGKSAEHDFKTVLLEGARFIIGVGFKLEDTVRKLDENQALLDSMDTSFGTKVKRVIQKIFGTKREHVFHEVEYLDPVTSQRRVESIDYTEFSIELLRRAQNLSSMVSKTGSSFKRMENSDEDTLYKFLAKSIEEMQSFHRRLTSLDDFFMETITEPDFKGRVRNIKIELGVIKNAIIKANQKRHEYLAQKEELEQLKRLGIKET